ncbi:MAG: hypothetical protein WBL20_14395 [Sphingobium sp.]|uniref:hypothetical protein n=1 Tax=Sphingobium sp. TaxID=1912891 RepID=UPI002E1CCDD8
MSFYYDAPTGTILDTEDMGLIAELAETVSVEDGMAMAAATDLYDALSAIIYASIIGELLLPEALFVAGHDALLKASPPQEGGPR